MRKNPELLAPAGMMEKLKMALLYGADAAYLGGKAFGLRAFGGNFTNEEIRAAVNLGGFCTQSRQAHLCDGQHLSA